MEFIHQILNDIGPATPGNWYCFTMDNLNAHRNDGVVALIHAFGHGIVYRAPYYPIDGPIEFVFNTLQSMVRTRLYEVKNGQDLTNVLSQSIQSIYDFSTYFEHVGFIIP